jgi:hypothetical protein
MHPKLFTAPSPPPGPKKKGCLSCTHDPGKKESSPPVLPPLPPDTQKKKDWPACVHAGSPHGLQGISIPNSVPHHFWPRPMAGAELWGYMK